MSKVEKDFLDFIKNHEAKIIPKSIAYNINYFNASVSGDEKIYKKAEQYDLELNKILADNKSFNYLKRLKEKNEITEPVLLRELKLLYNMYAAHQYNEELLNRIVELSNKIEKKFAIYRVKFKNKIVTDNMIDDILQNSDNSDEVELAWKSSKSIGKEIEKDVLKLVNLRNKASRQLGFSNYFEMSLTLNELDISEIDALFDELDKSIRVPFKDLKQEIDLILAAKFKIDKKDLMPWHYGDRFFQQGPQVYKVDFDKYFKNKDIVEITRKYYDGIGLNIDDVIKKSDLFEKPGKYQHAYCINIDKQSDIRVVCNVKPNYRWMNTMLHEFGHAAYDKFISPKLPWTLKDAAHTFTTEAVAMMFGRFASSPVWLKDNLNISLKEYNEIADSSRKTLRFEQIIFSRWVQVIYRFEKAMYENPNQNLNELWWNLVEKYQLLQKPVNRDEPDWASKIHIALYPAYYQNYMLGEILASQLFFYIKNKVLNLNDKEKTSFTGNSDVGNYLKNLFFSYGSVYYWNDLIKNATGERLTPKYYLKQFITDNL